MFNVVPAVLSHAQQISDLINTSAEKAFLLKRPYQDVCTNIRNFHVALQDNIVIGCSSLYIYSDTLAEIRSLAVDTSMKDQGIGKALLSKMLTEAGRLKVKKVFALTMIPDYFLKYGFKQVNRSTLPEKIWNDCIKCPCLHQCKEIPVIIRL
jgi:amino-acid N-acetyltransferase